MDEPGTRDLLFDYSVAKIFVSPDSMTITSWFCDGGPNIDFAGLAEAKKTGEVLNIEFNTSPQVFGRDAAFHYFVGFGHESKLSHLSAFLVVELRGHVSNYWWLASTWCWPVSGWLRREQSA